MQDCADLGGDALVGGVVVPVIILRHQHPVCRVEPQVRIGAEVVASGIGVAVDDGF